MQRRQSSFVKAKEEKPAGRMFFDIDSNTKTIISTESSQPIRRMSR